MEAKGCGRRRDNEPATEWERAYCSADSALAIDPALVCLEVPHLFLPVCFEVVNEELKLKIGLRTAFKHIYV